ncbi:hypothetical protein NORO109296_19580 [Nocardiopsis rhodophaea]
MQGRGGRAGQHSRQQGLPAQTMSRSRDVRGPGLRRCAAVPGVVPVQQAGHAPAGLPDGGEGRLPVRLRAVPRAQAARLPGDHRGEQRLQPRLPDLLRRLRTSTRRVLHYPLAVRADARHLRGGRGRTRGGDVLRRRAHDPQGHPRLHRPRPAAPHQGRQPQHQRHPAGLRPALRRRACRARRAQPHLAQHLLAVRRLRRSHPPRHPRQGLAGAQAQGTGQLRRGRAHRHPGRRRRARP